jgi:hypothetical protein
MKENTTRSAAQEGSGSTDTWEWWRHLTTRERNICRYAAVSFTALLTIGGNVWVTVVLVANFMNAARLLGRVELPE